MTTNFNRYHVHDYRNDSRHEERNDYFPHGHGYRIVDDVAFRLGINDGWIVWYVPSAGEETIQWYQPHHDSPANRNSRPVKEVKVSPNGIRFPFNPLNGFLSRFKEGFVGCLGCSFEQHIFASCLDRR